MLRRHPILISAILLLLLLGAGLLFLARYLDGAHYHERLQAELSTAFGHPVRMGQAAFTLKRGPALAVSDLHVDAGEVGFDLEAELLYLQLEWGALLRGSVEFSRILLISPRLHITLLPRMAGVPSHLAPPANVLKWAAVSSLAVEEGHILFEDRRNTGRTARVAAEGIWGEITDLAPDRSAWVRLSGRLPSEEGASTFIMAGEITLPAESALWEDAQVRLGLLSETFRPCLLEDLLPIPGGVVAGEGRLEITLDGTPSTGLRGTLRLGGSELTLRPSKEAYLRPAPLPLELSAVWVAHDFGHLLRDISLKLDDIVLQGELKWEKRKGGSVLQANFHSAPFPISSLGRYFPDWGERQKELASGTLELSNLEIGGSVDLLRAPGALLSALSGEAVLHDGEVPLSSGLQQIRAKLRLEDGALFIEEGSGVVMDSSVRFSGIVEELFSTAPSLQASVESALETENLLPFLPPEARERLDIRGVVPLSMVVTGGSGELHLDASADLSDLSARWDPGMAKDAGEEGSLTLSAHANREGWNLHFARLRLPGVELRANGFHPHGSDDFHLDLQMNVPDLQAAHPLIPALSRIEARGAAEVRGKISRTGSELIREGTLFLRGAGLRPGVVAEINQATGTIHLTEKGAKGLNLTARLGTSPVIVDAKLENFSEPRLHLHVRSDAIRADEIIFPSPRAILRDVDGHLTIERDRVGFSPVNVRLDGGTTAIVEGEVRDFSNPVVELDIRAAYGGIDEVIALWEAPREPGRIAAEMPERKDHNTRVRISAAVEEGRIGNLKFEQAKGIISWEQGVLTIHPLHFGAAGGLCTGRVLVESGPERHLLSVSGHLEDADAAYLQQELLHYSGLVSGNLRGDFFIKGEIGADFRRTSRGGAHLVVERGVLRRFNSLSKIFSLLNISQIFSGQLPDMAREGMPFNRLSATFSLEEGVLQTEDLLIDSNAMNLSLVGEVDLVSEKVDTVVAVQPLRTVDKIVTRIPVAGWVLTGEEKALITAHFQIRGPFDAAEIIPVPVTSLSEKAIGIFRRLFGLPARFIENLEEFVRPEPD